jgi:peptide/nickel transport system permease protein
MTTPTAARRTQAGGTVLFVLLIGVALAAPLLAPYPPDAMLDIVARKSQPPSAAHPFGTDEYSRDVLSRVLHGAQVSLAFSLASVLLSLVVSTTYAALAAFGPPALRVVLRRALDVVMSVPRLLVLLAVAGVAGPFGLPALILIVGLTGWFASARMITDELEALSAREFTQAARAQGVRTSRLLLRHLMPHLIPLLVITGTFGVADTIGLEAGLSYLGLGIQPPTASWGTMLKDGATVIGSAWWMTVFPGLALVVPVIACHSVGNALRERFAPSQFDRP